MHAEYVKYGMIVEMCSGGLYADKTEHVWIADARAALVLRAAAWAPFADAMTASPMASTVRRL